MNLSGLNPAGALVRVALRHMVRHGALTLRSADGTTTTFQGGPGPAAAFALKTTAAERRFLLDPGVALGELYMAGDLEPLGCTIHGVLDLLFLNVVSGGGNVMETAMRRFRRPLRRLRQLNPVRRARSNVAHHYDLDARLYELFLDEDRFYSCAYFETGAESLEQAQRAKVRHIAAKLHLDRPGLEVLDIGSGWGGLAIALARDHGATVTGITLSTEQLAESRRRAEAAGLSHRVRFELMDYRAWTTPVDRVVSVGMFEHVGIVHYRAFIQAIRAALRPGGVALIHAIGRANGPGVTNPWLARYIFPGGYSPALSEVVPLIEQARLWITDIEILRLHYAETIGHWRRRFAANRPAIAALYDERFCRMFEFYLAACEATFRHADHMVWQMQLANRVDALPITRDYMRDDREGPSTDRLKA